MISVSSDYKQYINNNTAVSAQNKIIVDGVEYLGDKLKTFPKISHSSSKICGSFPAKKVSFEIYDLQNNLDFEGKEIEVYKGLMINGSPYYVKQGVFIPKTQDITTNISNKTIVFENVQDKTQFLEDAYESNLDWSNNATHTGLEIVEEICNNKNITLKNDDFAFADYHFHQPNFPSGITNRQVLASLAEIGGEIVIFDYNGELEFKSQYSTEDTINRDRFEKISEEKTVTFNTVVLGKEGINDDIVYPTTISEDRVTLRIEDNPFVDLYRQEMIEDVADHIIGLSYTPFDAKNVFDGFIYELNDVISITDRNNNTLRAVILDINNSSRIKSDLKLDLSISDATNYDLAGSNKQSLKSVRLDIDHINNEIVSVVSDVEEISSIVNGTYQLTEDTTFQSDKIYYILSNGEYVEYTNYNVGDTIPTNTIYELKDDIRSYTSSQIKQTKDDIEVTLNRDYSTKQDLENYANSIKHYLRYEREGQDDARVVLGEEGTDSTIELRLKNDIIYFWDKSGGDASDITDINSPNVVAYISEKKLYIKEAEILTQIVIGNFAFTPRSNGSLSFKKVK